MKKASTRPAGWMFALCVLAGCSSTFSSASVDASAYAAMSCSELNAMLRSVSRELSQAAINRGKVARTDIPTWVPGGKNVASKVIDRQTAGIEALQQRERAVASARDRNCARP
jgi:hypothetical protein